MDIEKLMGELTLEEKAQLCSGGDFWHTRAIPRLGIPAVMICDGPSGLRKQTGESDHLGIHESIATVCYPSASAMACTFDRGALQRLGSALGEECREETVGMLLGPGVNIKRSPLCGRNFEYYSEDPYLTGELVAAYIAGLQRHGVAACVKHFATNNQETERHSISAQVDERTLHELYLPAFETSVKKGKVYGVMCAYNALNDIPCAENELLLKTILRKRWGFEGVTVSDWGAVENSTDSLRAGLELEMPGGVSRTSDRIVAAVRAGTLAPEELDKAVRDILGFVDACTHDVARHDPEAAAQRIRLCRELAEQSAVLLTNNGVLPLAPEEEVAVIGELAQMPRYQGGGSSHVNSVHPVSAWESMPHSAAHYEQGYSVEEEEPDPEQIHRAVELAKRVKKAVIFAGLPEKAETEGADRSHMRLPRNQNALIQAVADVQPNTVVVLHTGAPVELPWLDRVAAVLCMYLGGERVGEATVSLLYGKVNPSGHLAESWPLRLQDTPAYLNFPGERGRVEYREGIYVGYRYYDKKQMPVTFPFGHGLSYTSFRYWDLSVSSERLDDTQTLTVRCKVTNTGDRKGKAVAQLYVGALSGNVSRPVRELRGFAKLELVPGETGEAAFCLGKRDFAYYEPLCRDWHVESGDFRLEIGASSRDLALSRTVYVRGTTRLPHTFTRASTMKELLNCAAGKAFVETLMQGVRQNQNSLAHMGEGSSRRVQHMLLGMPLRSLVTYGRLSDDALDALIRQCNAEEAAQHSSLM